MLVKQTFEEALDESSLGVDQFSEPRIGGPSWPKQVVMRPRSFTCPPLPRPPLPLAGGQQAILAGGLRQNPELLPNGSP